MFANLDGAGTLDDLSVLSLIENGYADWAADFSTITDSKTNPVTTTTFTTAGGTAGFHARMVITKDVTTTNLSYDLLYADNANRINLYEFGHTALVVRTFYLGAQNQILFSGAAFDGTAQTIDIVVSGGTVALWLNNVRLLEAGAIPAALLPNTNGVISFGGTTTVQSITTHPYPALGIATDRVIAPQAADTATHTADCLMVARNVNLPTGASLQYELRKVGSDEITLDIDSNGKPILKENATAKITGANGNVSEDDDVVVILDGANVSLFSDGTQIGSTVTDLSLTAGTTFNMASIGTAGSTNSVELWPRDVSSILPTELV